MSVRPNAVALLSCRYNYALSADSVENQSYVSLGGGFDWNHGYWDRMMRCLRCVALAASLAGGCEARAAAQEPRSSLYSRFEVDAGVTLLVMDETIRIDPEDSPGSGTEIAAEDLLGVSRTTFQPRATLRWRPLRRHELEAGIFRSVRSGEQTLAETIVVGDTSFSAGAQVHSAVRTSQAFVTYRFAFTARETTQLGAALGVGALFFRTQIDALAGATGGGTDTSRVEYSEISETTVPTVSLGVYGRFLLGDRWYLETELRGVYQEIGTYAVRMLEGGVAGRHFFSRTVGAELGYDLGYYRVSGVETTESGDFRGQIKYIVHGFRGGIVVRF